MKNADRAFISLVMVITVLAVGVLPAHAGRSQSQTQGPMAEGPSQGPPFGDNNWSVTNLSVLLTGIREYLTQLGLTNGIPKNLTGLGQRSVPIPGSLGAFGGGLFGVVLWRTWMRRRQKDAVDQRREPLYRRHGVELHHPLCRDDQR